MAPDPLPAELLARRAALPRKPAPTTLTGPTVDLRPLELSADAGALHAASNGDPISLGRFSTPRYDADERIWRYMSGGPFATSADLAAWLATQVAAPDALPMAVRAEGHLVGVACFMANHPEHLRIELGSIWYSPAAQGTGVAREATRLILGHAFALGYRRVEWKCDAANLPSRRAALAYGFTFEGIQQAHLIVKDRNRDTAWFRMLDVEWSDREPRLRAFAGG